jgi:Na+-driven multidrug efflux pump
VSSLLTIGLDSLLIPIWGAVGAAVVSSFTYIIAFMLAAGLFRRLVGVKMADLLIPQARDVKAMVWYLQLMWGEIRKVLPVIRPDEVQTK